MYDGCQSTSPNYPKNTICALEIFELNDSIFISKKKIVNEDKIFMMHYKVISFKGQVKTKLVEGVLLCVTGTLKGNIKSHDK